jgi:hypothetical protein
MDGNGFEVLTGAAMESYIPEDRILPLFISIFASQQ